MPREGGLKNNDESGWGSSDVKEGASSVNEANRGDFCCARRVWLDVRKRNENASEDLCGRTSKNRGSPESKMGEGEGKEREAERPRYAQGANDVSRRPKEDRSRATRSMGEGKEGSQVTQSVHTENRPPIRDGEAGVMLVVEGQMECRTKDELEAHVSDIRSLAASPNLSSKEKEAVARAERFAIGLLKEHNASGHDGKKCPYATQLFY